MNAGMVIRLLTAAVVLAVAAFAAVASPHLRPGRLHGQSGTAARLPLCVGRANPGCVASAPAEARNGHAGPALARSMLALDIAATVAANVGFGPVGAIVSAWPRGVLGAAEMALGMIRRARSVIVPVTTLRHAPALSGKTPRERARHPHPETARPLARSLPVRTCDRTGS